MGSGYSSCDIRRIGLASSNMGKLDRVWSNRQLSLSSKLCIYFAAVRVWGVNNPESWPAEASILPSALPAVYTGDMVWLCHADVSAHTCLTDVHSIISQRRHALFGHIRRLHPDTPAHKVLHMAVQLQHRNFRPDTTWRRPPGRPRWT